MREKAATVLCLHLEHRRQQPRGVELFKANRIPLRNGLIVAMLAYMSPQDAVDDETDICRSFAMDPIATPTERVESFPAAQDLHRPVRAERTARAAQLAVMLTLDPPPGYSISASSAKQPVR